MWLALELKVDAAQVLALSDALLEEGALSVDVSDAQAGTDAETPIFQEPGQDIELAFGDNRLLALFDPQADVARTLERACALAGVAPVPAYQIAQVQEQDWVRLTQNQFSPIQVSPRLWIVPSWHKAPDASAINILLDPGLAFGTGSHPTTHLCLDWLERYLVPGSSVIDYGCGSGILAIAAARLGASTVVGVDIDPQAVVASRYNAQRNGIEARFSGADDPTPEPADVVVANILTNPLKVLAPLLAELALPGGHIVLSGILLSQADAVAAEYVRWFELDSYAEREGWIRVTGVRRG
ncbi:MAG TPA: 50S ribosomal protein L11 methyltransferase [Burkholderiales bacterium]